MSHQKTREISGYVITLVVAIVGLVLLAHAAACESGMC
jgi:hypothetical protein